MKKLQGICSLCGCQHDLAKNGYTMVRHGWTMNTTHSGYRYQVGGNCSGSGWAHFGSLAGRGILEMAIQKEEKLIEEHGHEWKPGMLVDAKAWVAWQKERLANWKEHAPVAVEKVKAVPAVHLAQKVYGINGTACCASAMAAQRKAWSAVKTTNPDEVTCSACLKAIERRRALEASKK